MTYDDIVMCVNDTIDNSRFDVLTPFKMRAMLTLLRKAVPELKPVVRWGCRGYGWSGQSSSGRGAQDRVQTTEALGSIQSSHDQPNIWSTDSTAFMY